MEREQRKHKVVYTIVERDRDGRKFWLRIGAAFPNQDGSMNVLLDAMPTNGQLHIRDYRPTDGRTESSRMSPVDEALPDALAS